MIGLIISGHGHFATGLRTSLKLIAGEPTNTQYVDFEETDNIESLREKYYGALENLANCDSVLALTDLAGGSPFKTLVEVSIESKKAIQVVGGTNLPMALEISMTKDIFDDLTTLCDSAVDCGKNSVMKFELTERKEEINEEDGI